MKKLMQVTEVEGEGLLAMLGEEVLLLCSTYFYAGKLVGVNTTDVELEDASIVYETGAWDAKAWLDAQKLPAPLYVRTSMIEAYLKVSR